MLASADHGEADWGRRGGACRSYCAPSVAPLGCVACHPSLRRGSVGHRSCTTMAKDVHIRRKPLCPLRSVWLMHSTSTAAPSVGPLDCRLGRAAQHDRARPPLAAHSRTWVRALLHEDDEGRPVGRPCRCYRPLSRPSRIAHGFRKVIRQWSDLNPRTPRPRGSRTEPSTAPTPAPPATLRIRMLTGTPVPSDQVRNGPRTGVAGEGGNGDVHPWRFWVADDPTVSPYRAHVPRRRRSRLGS